MDHAEFFERENKRAAKLSAAMQSAWNEYASDIRKAEEKRDIAIAKAGAADTSDRDDYEGKFRAARRSEVEAIVASANAKAGLDPEGNEKKSPPGQVKKAAKAKAKK